MVSAAEPWGFFFCKEVDVTEEEVAGLGDINFFIWGTFASFCEDRIFDNLLLLTATGFKKA